MRTRGMRCLKLCPGEQSPYEDGTSEGSGQNNEPGTPDSLLPSFRPPPCAPRKTRLLGASTCVMLTKCQERAARQSPGRRSFSAQTGAEWICPRPAHGKESEGEGRGPGDSSRTGHADREKMQEKVTYPEKPGLQLSARVKAGRTRFWVTSSQSNKRSIFFYVFFSFNYP